MRARPALKSVGGVMLLPEVRSALAAALLASDRTAITRVLLALRSGGSSSPPVTGPVVAGGLHAVRQTAIVRMLVRFVKRRIFSPPAGCQSAAPTTIGISAS